MVGDTSEELALGVVRDLVYADVNQPRLPGSSWNFGDDPHRLTVTQARVRSAELQLERAQIHADRAHRQFDGCEPENRLVARTLEREWEQRLTDVRAAERAVAEIATKRPKPLTSEEIAWCRQAGADLRKVFDAPSKPDRERKQLLRAILTDVVATVDRTSEQHTAQLQVAWEGGQITEHTVALPRTGSHTRCTDQDTIALVRHFAERYPDKQIAAILSRQGRRTGAGNQFTAHNVHGLRSYHKIPACPVRTASDDGEMVTIAKAAQSSTSPPPPCTAGCARGSSSASRSRPARPGRSGSPTSSASASAPRRPTGGCRSPTPPRRSASPARPCCTRSNAAN